MARTAVARPFWWQLGSSSCQCGSLSWQPTLVVGWLGGDLWRPGGVYWRPGVSSLQTKPKLSIVFKWFSAAFTKKVANAQHINHIQLNYHSPAIHIFHPSTRPNGIEADSGRRSHSQTLRPAGQQMAHARLCCPLQRLSEWRLGWVSPAGHKAARHLSEPLMNPAYTYCTEDLLFPEDWRNTRWKSTYTRIQENCQSSLLNNHFISSSLPSQIVWRITNVPKYINTKEGWHESGNLWSPV